ncbi:MAG: hypothetical protein R6V12_10455 [Candidatus Hydrogenedentota bacterium]
MRTLTSSKPVMGMLLLSVAAMARAEGSENAAECENAREIIEDADCVPVEKAAPQDPAKWFFLFALVNTYPKLDSEKPIDRFFNPAMRFLAPSFDDVYTISDLRDDHLIWPPHIGIGRVLSRRWSLFFQCGYASGKVRTKATDPSILLFPLHTDFEIQRGAAYAGVGLDFFPLGQVEQKKYTTWRERFLGTKPVIGFRYTGTYALYDAKVKVGFVPFGNILSLKLDDAWWVSSVNANIGLDMPITRRTHLTCNAGYNFFFNRAYDFEGSAYTLGIKRYF